MNDVVIVSAVRTPTGKFLGGLKSLTAPQLGSLVIREAVRRAGVEPGTIEECIMGHVLSAGVGQAPARQAALGAGLDAGSAALTINKVCGSGLKAVMLAAQGIATGDVDLVVAGGMESMSNAPHLVPRLREGLRMGNGVLIDSVLHDGLWCAFEQHHMGVAAEIVADAYHVTREQQDVFAAESHAKAAHALDAGALEAEILPVEVDLGRHGRGVVSRDESVRADTSVSALAALRPAFKDGGTVTAGNAPPLSDGAAALVLMSQARATALGVAPLARIVAQTTSGLSPRLLLMTPVEAVRKLLRKTGWTLDTVDLLELNEAFAAQAVAVLGELGLDPAKVNVHGGAVALGHPIGASGARILTTLLHALRRRGLRRGIATLCLGGGNGVALAVERDV
ncbi:MAG: acetyl-CoA C-acetyltransferase [Acidobacteria bacterium]|nr:acetyl-CoA C-acetyltransferase [Acidobacteriota bacterium]